MFGSLKNQTKANLDVVANIGRVSALVDLTIWPNSNSSEVSDFIKKADETPPNPDIDLDFSPTVQSAPLIKKPKVKQMTDAELLGM